MNKHCYGRLLELEQQVTRARVNKVQLITDFSFIRIIGL